MVWRFATDSLLVNLVCRDEQDGFSEADSAASSTSEIASRISALDRRTDREGGLVSKKRRLDIRPCNGKIASASRLYQGGRSPAA